MPAPNVILLFGNDEYAMQRRQAEFEAGFDDPTGAAMNTARLEARSMAEDELNNAVNAMPFLARQRLVLLSNPSARYTTPQARKKFLELVEKAPPTTKLVIREDVELKWRRDKDDQQKEDDKHWPVKWFRAHALGLERFALPTPWEMPRWITGHVEKQGGRIEPAGASRLSELVGPNPRQAMQEIDKLLAYVNWSRPISLQDVEAASVVTAEADVFAMLTALAQGNGHDAQRMLHRLLDDQDPFAVWPLMVWQFRQLLLARDVIDAGGSLPDVQKQLGLNPKSAEKLFPLARRFNMPVLERIFHRLLEIDEAAKSGRAPLDVSMQVLVAELTT